MTAAQGLVFYFGIPVVLAAFMTLQRTGPGHYLGMSEAFAFWTMSLCLAWWLNDLATRAVAGALGAARRRAPLWLVLAMGALLGLVLNVPTQEWRFELFLTAEQSRLLAVPMPAVSKDYAWLMLRSWTTGAAVWLAANYLLWVAWRLPRYGYPAPSTPLDRAAAAATPSIGAEVEQVRSGHSSSPSLDPPSRADSPTDGAFLQEPPASTAALTRKFASLIGASPQSVMAVQAQEHYCLVFRESGPPKLVSLSFTEALSALAGEDGAQVHRSYWVARRAIRHSTRTPSGWKLTLLDNLVVPVGRTYLLDLRRRGFLDIKEPTRIGGPAQDPERAS